MVNTISMMRIFYCRYNQAIGLMSKVFANGLED